MVFGAGALAPKQEVMKMQGQKERRSLLRELRAILYSRELTPMERLLLQAMRDLSKEGAGCFARQKTLSAKLGVSRPTISRTISKLLSKGYLRERKAPQTRRTKTYDILVSKNDTPQVSDFDMSRTVSKPIPKATQARFSEPNRVYKLLGGGNESNPYVGGKLRDGGDFYEEKEKRKKPGALELESKPSCALCRREVEAFHPDATSLGLCEKCFEAEFGIRSEGECRRCGKRGELAYGFCDTCRHEMVNNAQKAYRKA